VTGTRQVGLWSPIYWFLAVATASRRTILFRFVAVGFALAAIYHLAALAIPTFARVAYPPAYPVLRHVAFVIVDSPRWFIWPYVLLTLQVLQGHDVRAWQTWVQEREIQWIDDITVLGILLGLVLLFLDRAHWNTRRFCVAHDDATLCPASSACRTQCGKSSYGSDRTSCRAVSPPSGCHSAGNPMRRPNPRNGDQDASARGSRGGGGAPATTNASGWKRGATDIA